MTVANGILDTPALSDLGTYIRADASVSSLALVASGCGSANSLTVPNKQIQFRTAHVAFDDITSLQVMYGNWYVASGAELPGGAVASINVGVEYPYGAYTRCTFSGGNTGSIPNGGQLLSDATPVFIRKGSIFWLNGLFQSTAGAIYGGVTNTYFGEKTQIAASGLTDPSVTGFAAGYTVGAITLRPLVIIAQTRVASVTLYGDSRAYGDGDSPSGEQMDMGLARVLGKYVPVANLARSGASAAAIAGAFTNRAALSAYTTASVLEPGINDLNGGSGPTTVQNSLNTLRATLAAGKPVFNVTYEPVTTSTDGWTTTANQTVGNVTTQGNGTAAAVEINRKAMNTWALGRPAGWAGYLDNAAAVESGGTNGSGLWLPATPGLTADGTHGTRLGYVRQRDASSAPVGLLQGA